MRPIRTTLPELVQGPPGQVLALLNTNEEAAWLVGGAVRDASLGRCPGDLDIATTWRPEDVLSRAQHAGLKAIPTGMDHGTITVVLDGAGLEVTTLRRDVATDGRRAVVAFTRDLAEDAARRDFTINALYLDQAGQVIDPLGAGLADLAAGRVRFIGGAEQRLREDYLRILRFFRFSASHADPAAGLDRTGLAACADLRAGLAQISAERIWAELAKLLALPRPFAALVGMAESGVLDQVVRAADLAQLERLLALEAEAGTDGLARLAALAPQDKALAERLRLSRREAKRLAAYRAVMTEPIGPMALGYRWREAAPVALVLRHAHLNTAPRPAEWAALRAGQTAIFPLRAVDLPPSVQGAAIGQALREAEQAWLDSGCRLSREDLRKRL